MRVHHSAGMLSQFPRQNLSQPIWGPCPLSWLEALLLPDAQDTKLQVAPKQMCWQRGQSGEEQMAPPSRVVIRP